MPIHIGTGNQAMLHRDVERSAAVTPPIRESEPRPRHDARRLTEGGPEAEILLDGTRYVLRITRQRKLILTK
jgi:hemin uptake protein HemP